MDVGTITVLYLSVGTWLFLTMYVIDRLQGRSYGIKLDWIALLFIMSWPLFFAAAFKRFLGGRKKTKPECVVGIVDPTTERSVCFYSVDSTVFMDFVCSDGVVRTCALLHVDEGVQNQQELLGIIVSYMNSSIRYKHEEKGKNYDRTA